MNKYYLHLPSTLTDTPARERAKAPAADNLTERRARLGRWLDHEYEALQALSQKGEAGSPEYEHRFTIWEKGLAKYAALSDVLAMRSWKEMTICWPAGAPIATIGDQWMRLPDGQIEATYKKDELALALAAVAESDEEALRIMHEA